jgi:RNA polymerase-binding transcription factor DksA
MLRALLLCELIEQIDITVATATRPAGERHETVGALQKTSAVRHALDRLDDGSYGTCDACGTQIPVAELELEPTRAACAACAPGMERRLPCAATTGDRRFPHRWRPQHRRNRR